MTEFDKLKAQSEHSWEVKARILAALAYNYIGLHYVRDPNPLRGVAFMLGTETVWKKLDAEQTKEWDLLKEGPMKDMLGTLNLIQSVLLPGEPPIKNSKFL